MRRASPALDPTRRRMLLGPSILARGSLAARRRPFGEVAEWLKAPHSKCGIRATVSGVRISPSPPSPDFEIVETLARQG